MLKLAKEKGVKPWLQKRSMKEINEAVVDMVHGKRRYRYVWENRFEERVSRGSECG